MDVLHVVHIYNGILFSNKRDEVIIYAAPWTNLENSMLSERSQPQKTIDCVIPFTGNVQSRQIQTQEVSWQDPGAAWGQECLPVGTGLLWEMMTFYIH
jgi:hypothetical protein